MKIEGEGQCLRIFVGESDRAEGKPLHDVILRRAREAGLAGATVMRGMAGFGAASRIHTTKVLRLSDDLPLVIEIVDREDRITSFLPVLDGLVEEGMITVEPVHIVAYRHRKKGDSS